MSRFMANWLIFAALGAIGITAVLIWVLYRINLPAPPPERREGE